MSAHFSEATDPQKTTVSTNNSLKNLINSDIPESALIKLSNNRANVGLANNPAQTDMTRTHKLEGRIWDRRGVKGKQRKEGNSSENQFTLKPSGIW